MSFKNLSLLALAAGALYLMSSKKSTTNVGSTASTITPHVGTEAGGVAYLQEATMNPSAIMKPVSVVSVATTPGVQGFAATVSNEVPANVFQATQDIRIEGITAPIANIPAGALVSSNELAWISTVAADEVYRESQVAAQQAANVVESSYYASNVGLPAAGTSGSAAWNDAWTKTDGARSALLTEALYQEIKTKYAASTSMGSILEYAKSINGNYSLYSWFAGHAVQMGAVNGKPIYRWA